MPITSPRNLRKRDEKLRNGGVYTRSRSLGINVSGSGQNTVKNISLNKKKLNKDDIIKDLDSSDSEFEITSFANKNKLNNYNIRNALDCSNNESNIIDSESKNTGKNQTNHSSITLKFLRLPGQFKYKVIEHKIGSTEKKLLHGDKLMRTRSNINYNIKQLWNEHEKTQLDELDSKVPMYRKSNKTLNQNEAEEFKVNTRKRSVQIVPKYESSGETDQESEHDKEIDENVMYNANSNLSPKRLKTKNQLLNQISTEHLSQSKTPPKRKNKSVNKSMENLPNISESKTLNHTSNLLEESINNSSTDTLKLKTPSKRNNILKDSADKSLKDISTLKTPSKKDLKSSRKSIITPTKLSTKFKTPSKSDINNLKISMNTPTKGFEGLKLNESLQPTSCRRNKNIFQNNSTPNKSISKLLDDDFERTPKVKPRFRSARFSKSYFSHSESEDKDDSDDFKVNSDSSEDESSDISDNTSEDVSLNSEDGSSNEDLYSRKYKKYTKHALVTPKKSVKKNLKTPSKSLIKTPKVSMETPTRRLSRLSLKNSMSPSVHQRTANVSKPSTPLQEIRQKLHVSVLPKSLPCREEQFNDIYTYLHSRLSDGCGGCIYISGVPGTGKTATVNEVIRCLKKAMNNGKLTNFEFVDINGMKLSEPRQVYVQIWKQLTGETVTWEAAQKLLQNKFTKTKSKKDITLLLIDELDLLCTKRQDVVYNLLDWPSQAGTKLVVVTIANTMDLPERILMGKVTSRLGLTRLTFPPYNHNQLEQIVQCRLLGYSAFGGDTVQLVARKVAAVSGDARRALDICRRSTEIAEINNREIVSMIDVKQALDEMIASPKIQAIKHCSDMEKFFLKAVCAEVQRTGVEEVVFKNVYFHLHTLCAFDGEQTPNVTEALSMCARLSSWRLLLCDHSKMDIHQRLLLNVTTDDVQFAVEN